ncbi:MAG: recombination regulator RecX [Clostridiaceae bacterium]|nr:recombination regulator RecX [Clostridiaceae bacterium]
MSLLQHNDRTEWELRDRLVRAGFSEEVVEDAIAYVESYHYIDDARYASRFVEIYRESRSIQRIRQDLLKRHVREELIEEALEKINWDDSPALEKEMAKLLKGKQPDTLSYEEKQKLAAKLYRRGFLTDAIYRKLEQWECR